MSNSIVSCASSEQGARDAIEKLSLRLSSSSARVHGRRFKHFAHVDDCKINLRRTYGTNDGAKR
jgi:hypothetical protein